jgi:hypothetical protein
MIACVVFNIRLRIDNTAGTRLAATGSDNQRREQGRSAGMRRTCPALHSFGCDPAFVAIVRGTCPATNREGK